MNLYARLLAVLGVALSVVAALGMVVLAAGGLPQATAASDMLQASAGTMLGRAGLGLAGVFLLFLVAYLAMKAMGYGASKVLSFKTASGVMKVDISALEDCLNRTAMEVEDVLEARSNIRHTSSISKPVDLRLNVVLAERSDVPGKGAEISARISERFLQIIPIETRPNVNLAIRIRAPKAAPTKPEKPAPAPPEEPEPVEKDEGFAQDIEAEPDMDIEDVAPQADDDLEEDANGDDEDLDEDLDGDLDDVPDFTGERRYNSDEQG